MFKNIEAMLQDLYVMGLEFTALKLAGDATSAACADTVVAIIARLTIAIELDKMETPNISYKESLN